MQFRNSMYYSVFLVLYNCNFCWFFSYWVPSIQNDKKVSKFVSFWNLYWNILVLLIKKINSVFQTFINEYISDDYLSEVFPFVKPAKLLTNGSTPAANHTTNGSTVPISNNPFTSEIQKELPAKVNNMQTDSPNSSTVSINSKEVSSTSTGDKKSGIGSIAPDSSEDPYSYLDWKDGIATLPGTI